MFELDAYRRFVKRITRRIFYSEIYAKINIIVIFLYNVVSTV